MLGDAEKVKYFPLSAKERFEALKAKQVDVLARNTTWTLTRDAELGLTFVGVNFYDGQGFMVPKASGIKSTDDFKLECLCVRISGQQQNLTLRILWQERFRI